MLTDDGRRDDGGRTTDDGVIGILIAHLGAFGSGELKTREGSGFKFLSLIEYTCTCKVILVHQTKPSLATLY